jgi:nitrate reductase gamma subunit
MTYLHQFIYGIYPYIALAIFLFGSLARFEREQYTWKSDSSQMLHTGNLRTGNILFHLGILGLFFGHLVGLLTPVIVWDTLGITHSFKQMIAMVAGGIFGTLCMVGLLILLHRRFSDARISAVTKTGDKVLLLWIFITLGLGLSTIFESANHSDGHMMVLLMTWAQHIVTFKGDAAEFIVAAPLLFKLHLFMGLSLFVIFLSPVWYTSGAALLL